MSVALGSTLILNPPDFYFGSVKNKWIAFVAGYLLTVVQSSSFQGQTFVAEILIFLLWIALKRYILLYKKHLPEWQKDWGTAIEEFIKFITFTLFFIPFWHAIFLLEDQFRTNNINVQEIVTIILVFMLFIFTVSILYKTRIRRYQKWAQNSII